MRPALRTVPTARHWLAATLTGLLAVLLTTVPANTAYAGPGPAVNSAAAVSGAERVYTGSSVDDPGAADRAVQAGARHDLHAERPSPLDHHATGPHDPAALPANGARLSASPACADVSPGRSAHDRSRAPPAPLDI